METIKQLSNEELFNKLYCEVGTEAIELWVNWYCTEIGELSDEEWELFKKEFDKVDKPVQDNFVANTNQYELTWEFHRFICSKGITDEYDTWHFKFPDMSNATAQNKNQSNKNQTLSLNEALRTQPQIAVVQSNTKPKKDFSQTRYSDDFVSKYSLRKKNIKTDADKAFSQKWDTFTRTAANYLQQYVYGYDDTETYQKMNWLLYELKNYAPFLSSGCGDEFIERSKEALYKMSEVEKSKRL